MNRMTGDFRRELEALLGDRVRFDAPLAAVTAMGVGGPADALADVADERELGALLALCRRAGLPILVVGAGTNLVVRDGGWRGVALRLRGPRFLGITVEGTRIAAGSGAPLGELISRAAAASLTGPEFLAGIPGTVGGAVRMNAGARGRETGEWVEEALLMGPDGTARRLPGHRMGFSYRECAALRGAVLLEVVMRCERGDAREIESRRRAFAAEHARRLPAGAHAGCVFKNPAGGPPAGVLLERAGLKGARIGGAVVSGLHANVIVNEGGATAADVRALIDMMRNRVAAESGIELEMEIVVSGEEA